MLAEFDLKLGETIRPYARNVAWKQEAPRRSFSLTTNIGEVPFTIDTDGVYPGRVVPGIPDIPGIRVIAYNNLLADAGFAQRFIHPDGFPYRTYLFPPPIQAFLGRLRLHVRLPNPDVRLESAPWLPALQGDGQLEFNFFKQLSGPELPVFDFVNRRGFEYKLPCFLTAAPNRRLLETELRDVIAIPSDLDYQSRIEIFFASMEDAEELVVAYQHKNVAGLRALQARYQLLRREVRCEIVTAEEIKEMQEILGNSCPANDPTFIIECALGWKANKAALLEQKIQGYWKK